MGILDDLSPEDYFRRRMELLSSVHASPKTMAEALGRLEQEGRIAFPNEKDYKMAKTQQQLLDELDEARHELRAYRRGWVLDLLGLAVSLTSIIGGALLGATTGQAVLFILLGILGLILTLMFGFFWLLIHNPDKDGRGSKPPAARLRAAERAYRNSMLEQG